MYRKTILALGMLTRLGIVGGVMNRYPDQWLFRQAPDLCFLAASLAAGHGLSSPFGGSTGPSAFLAPGYPCLLGLIFHVCGSYNSRAALAIMLLQGVFALLTVAVIMHVAQRLFGAREANLAGMFWALSPPLLWLPAVLWETSLSTLLLIGMVALAVISSTRPGRLLWLAMGGYCAVAMLINPALTLALLTLLAWTQWQARCSRHLWLSLSLAALVFAPWPIRNFRVLHAFIPLRSNFGYELWQGNHPGASGLFDATREPMRNPDEYASYASLGEVAYMNNKATLAGNYIRHDPWEFLKLSGQRVLRFWSGSGSEVNSSVIELHALATSLLGLWGLALFSRERRATAVFFSLPLILFPIPYYLTHPDFRFRLVLDPLLTILSAHALVETCAWFKFGWRRAREVNRPKAR